MLDSAKRSGQCVVRVLTGKSMSDWSVASNVDGEVDE